ncbi:MAG TPA: hypothetical protein VHO06_24160 [Polyangia bacterium]|nr:hypothetical protein [Polyangia bacterium]
MCWQRLRLGSIFVASLVLAGAAGCSQGLGGRCVQNSDCSSGLCSTPSEITAEGGRCIAPGTTVVDASQPPQDAASDAAGDAGDAAAADGAAPGQDAASGQDAAPTPDAAGGHDAASDGAADR